MAVATRHHAKRMTRELEELLGHAVDVVSTDGLEGQDQHILSEAVDL